MSDKYKFFNGGLFFITMTVVGWIDVFTRKEYADNIVKNLNFCVEKKGLQIFEFCIMSSHIHMICAAKNGNVGKIIKDFKSFTAKEILSLIEQNPQESRKEWLLYMFKYFAKRNSTNAVFQFWQHGSHPISLESNQWIEQKRQYIWNNPVAAGIVSNPEDYIYSSASPLNSVSICC